MNLEDAYDPECELLAEHFLEDVDMGTTAETTAAIHSLAKAIQRAVDDWTVLNPAKGADGDAPA